MSEASTAQKEFLSSFGSRVNFDPVERLLYSHDIGSIPPMASVMLGNPVAKAVVQPQEESELQSIIDWCYRNRINVVPRGKATSGYGGVVPVKNGLVVDFYRMQKVVRIDKDHLTATVQPGITWELLDEELAKEGLTVTQYPSSYPSSSVGGWFSQGGAGFGSYENGFFRDTVVSVRVVTPQKGVLEVSGDDLDLYYQCEGITGFISELTIRIMPREEMKILAYSVDSSQAVQDFCQALINEDVPIWSVMFINPEMARMKNLSPVQTHFGHPVEHKISMPEKYLLTLAIKGGNFKKAHPQLLTIAEKMKAEALPQDVADHEWESRFKLMVVKRLGPSLVPAEFIVPLDRTAATLDTIGRKVSQPVVKEGIIIKNGRGGKAETVVLGFIPSDERKFSYNFMFGLSLSLLKCAVQHGGRPYSTGLYFAAFARQVIGSELFTRIKNYKKEVDPLHLLNPKKVLNNGLMGLFMTFTPYMEPMMRIAGNIIPTKVGERIRKPVRGIPGDVAWYAYACSQCGYCVDQCDQFYGRGWESQSPRGKWYWLRMFMQGKVQWDQKVVDTFIACTTCEICHNRCSAALPIEPSWMKLRGKLINEDKKMTFPPFEMMAAAARSQGNIWAGYRKNRDAWFPEDLRDKHYAREKSENVYFAGCTACFVETDIAIASTRLLDAAGVDFTFLGTKENCCATPMLAAGKWDVFEEIMRKNISAVKETGADTVICSCPACDMMWRHVYPKWSEKLGIDYGIKARHYSEVLTEKIASGEFSFPENGKDKVKVTWHDSCHMGRVSKIYEPPRDLIKAVPNAEYVEMEHNREESHCCGSVLTLIKEPEVAADIGDVKMKEAEATGATRVIAACPCCEFQLRVTAEKKNSPLEVVDLAHFAAEALDIKLPDPHPEVRAQWKVFEGMIALMTPEGFAALMDTMWKELIDAMPLGMGGMMKVCGKVPLVLPMMKPMFPVLFPVLLPMMMPKVLPTMVERIKERIPMPDYMAEQMPSLLPKVMDNLMPHMIGDVVPLITMPMIRYLQGK